MMILRIIGLKYLVCFNDKADLTIHAHDRLLASYGAQMYDNLLVHLSLIIFRDRRAPCMMPVALLCISEFCWFHCNL